MSYNVFCVTKCVTSCSSQCFAAAKGNKNRNRNRTKWRKKPKSKSKQKSKAKQKTEGGDFLRLFSYVLWTFYPSYCFLSRFFVFCSCTLRSACRPPLWLSGKAPASRQWDPGIEPYIPRSSHTSGLKMCTLVTTMLRAWHQRSALGLVGQVSVFCAGERHRVWSATCCRLVGLVVEVSAPRAEDPGFESRLRRDFSQGRVIPVI